MIFLGTIGTTGIYSSEYKKRIDWKMQMLHMFHLIISEISYKKTDLPDSFRNASIMTEGSFQTFLFEISAEWEKREGLTLNEIWKQKVFENFRERYIKKNDLLELTILGEQIGYQDLEMQIRVLNLFCEELKKSIEDMSKTYTDVKRISRVAGIFAGTVIVVLLV